MYPDWVLGVVALVGSIWLFLLTFLILQQGKFLKSLFPKSGERDIRKKFEEVISFTSQFDKKILDVSNRLGLIEENNLKHIQKVKLLRFNPYEDTGGDQSFSVCFLDKKGSGLVVTSLHTRSGTRVFAKPVLEGKDNKYRFSKEEQEVIDLAMAEK